MSNAELIAKIRAEIERQIEHHDSLASNAESEMIANLEIGAAQALDDILPFLSTLESEKPLGLEEEIKRYYDDMDGDCRYVQTARHFYNLGCRRTAEKYDEIEYNRQRAEESEKPMNLEGEINRYLREECSDDDEPSIHEIAEHFAQWGAEHYLKSEFLAKFAEMTGSIDTMPKNTLPPSKECEKGLREPLVSDDLEEAAKHHSEQYRPHWPNQVRPAYDSFIAGAKWQAEHAPLPEDTVLFNKGVAEGRRLAEEEQAGMFTIVALDAAQRAKEQMMKDAVKWLVDDDYHDLSEKGRFILGSVGLGYNGYYIPYSDLLKLPKEDEK